VRQYSFAVWLAICVVGSLTSAILVSGEFRSKIGLVWYLVKLRVKPSDDMYKEGLGRVVSHQKKFYANRKFIDSVSTCIIEGCIENDKLYSD
jgi:hypothetical protein